MSAEPTAPSECLMPRSVAEPEERFWRILRQHHCQQGHGYRECSGRIICDRNGVTLACPRCGDCRQRFVGLSV